MKLKTYSEIDDFEILRMIVSGILKFNGVGVLKWHHRNRRWYLLAKTRHQKSGRYRYNIRIGKRQRLIYANKLHWMLTHQQTVPIGYDIDHIDHDRYNDDPANLRLRGSQANQSDNWSDGQFAEVANFFDEIARNNANGDF